MVTRFLPVSFERTPPSEISEKAAALAAVGWTWIENRPARWVARVRKEFTDATDAERSEEEIQRAMGNRYVPIQEISARGSSRFFDNGEGMDPNNR